MRSLSAETPPEQPVWRGVSFAVGRTSSRPYFFGSLLFGRRNRQVWGFPRWLFDLLPPKRGPLATWSLSWQGERKLGDRALLLNIVGCRGFHEQEIARWLARHREFGRVKPVRLSGGRKR